MLKKFVTVSLMAAIMALPATGAFASESNDSTNFNSQISQNPSITSEAGDVSILSITWTVNTYCNFRETPSPTGVNIGSLVPGETVNGGRDGERVVNGVTWVNVYSPHYGKSGWIIKSYLTETG